MSFDKTKFDKKTLFSLIAFIAVGILLFFTMFAHNSMQKDKVTEGKTQPNANDNTPVAESAYYGKEVVELGIEAFDKNGVLLDLSTLTQKTDLYDRNGKMLNLPTISSEEYYSLEKGMSYAEVCEFIGGSGEKMKEIDKPGDEFYTVSYFFYGDKANSSATFIFQGDRLKSMGNTNINKED